MSKTTKYIIFFIAIIVFIGGMMLISDFLESAQTTSRTLKNSNEEANILEDKSGETETNSNKTTNNTENAIIEVTEKTFKKEVLQSDKKVLVDFYADWCGPCQIMHPILEEIAEENPDIKVVRVNIDYNYDLAMEYGAMSIPLFVTFEDGEEMDRMVGVVDKEYLIDMVK